MQKVRAFLRAGFRAKMNGSPARGSEQWLTVNVDGEELQVFQSGSGLYAQFEGHPDAPILPLVDMRIFREYLVPCDATTPPLENAHFIYGTAFASKQGGDYEIRCTVLEDGLELTRQIRAKTARCTSLPVKQAVAVAKRPKRRPLNPRPHCRRCHRPTYTGCLIPGGGRYYRLKGDR
jgi:hypothetical protein